MTGWFARKRFLYRWRQVAHRWPIERFLPTTDLNPANRGRLSCSFLAFVCARTTDAKRCYSPWTFRTLSRKAELATYAVLHVICQWLVNPAMNRGWATQKAK
jgi:hypothetical protein